MPIYKVDCTNMREVSKDVLEGQYSFKNNLTKRTLGTRKHAKNADQTRLYQETKEVVL